MNLVRNFLFSLFLIPCFVSSQTLQLKIEKNAGISLFKFREHVLINRNNNIGRGPMVEGYSTVAPDGTTKQEWSHVKKEEWRESSSEYQATYSWGIYKCKFRPIRDTLFLDIELVNTSKTETINGLSISPLSLQLGTKPSNFLPKYPYYANNISSPAVIFADLPSYRLVVENADVTSKGYVGLIQENTNSGNIYRLWLGTWPYNGMRNFDNRSILKLRPGTSTKYTIALKFNKAGENLARIAPKAYENYRKQHPFLLNWTDRRPIASVFLSSYSASPNKQSKRNWTFTKSLDLKSSASLKYFEGQLGRYVQNSLVELKKMDAQGIIVWDIEGQEFPHPVTYIGSPEHLPKLAPEMNRVADVFFRSFSNKGYKTGICIRPDSIIIADDGRNVYRVQVRDPAQTIIRKIRYARKRWGCTIFYIDSNFDPSGEAMDMSIFKKVAQDCPDVLLIPEHEKVGYFGFSAPYEELRMGTKVLSEDVKSLYPDAFMVLSVPDGIGKTTSVQGDINFLTQSVNQGNILLFRGWFDDQPTNGHIREVLKKAAIFKAQPKKQRE